MTELSDRPKVGVVGAGAWGTALAAVIARAGQAPLIWARETDVAHAINARRENVIFLPGIRLPDAVRATQTLRDFADRDLILIAVPAQHLRTITAELSFVSPAGIPILLCAKGIEQRSLKLMSEVAAEAAPRHPIAVLSGPSFAVDVAAGKPTAVTLAASDDAIAQRFLGVIGQPSFRPYLSDDVIGAEIGGAVKNVLAIACGIVDGAGLGESARAALITRGFAEMTRCAIALGGRAETLAGLSGLGDLVLTCSSAKSRNMSLGAALGRGEALAAILSSRNSVAEGVATAPALAELARKKGVEMPITFAIHAILEGRISVSNAIDSLLSRPFRAERDSSVDGT